MHPTCFVVDPQFLLKDLNIKSAKNKKRHKISLMP
jgi:hypothetical protein